MTLLGYKQRLTKPLRHWKMLELHELLDRYEILYPDNEKLSDLRRAVVDQDLSSIFRLLDDSDSDLRSAVLDDNLHSIFRLLEPFNIELHEDFRKAVVEQNIHSMFRLFEHYTNSERADHWHVADLRRATLEQNLYSLFRLFPEDIQEIDYIRTAVVNKNIRSITRLLGDEDLGKLILDHNEHKVFPNIEKYVDSPFTPALKSLRNGELDWNTDCLSQGQLRSKRWLVTELSRLDLDLGVVFLCAGWYGTLATMLFESDIKLERIHSFDTDPAAGPIAEIFNKTQYLNEWEFKSSTVDIHTMNYTTEPAPSDGTVGNFYFKTENFSSGKVIETRLKPNTFINTSTEHITDFDDWYTSIPFGSLIIMQGNNYHDLEEHVNTHKSLADFSWMCHMRKPLYEGELDLGDYVRYMKIGYK